MAFGSQKLRLIQCLVLYFVIQSMDSAPVASESRATIPNFDAMETQATGETLSTQQQQQQQQQQLHESTPLKRVRLKRNSRARKQPASDLPFLLDTADIQPGQTVQLTKAQQKQAEKQWQKYQAALEKEKENQLTNYNEAGANPGDDWNPSPIVAAVNKPAIDASLSDINKFRSKNPFGPFNGQFGWTNNTNAVVLGTGFTAQNSYNGGFPQIYTQRVGVDAYALGRQVAEFPRHIGVGSDGSVASYNVGVERGGTVLNTGIEKNRGGHGGITGYSWGRQNKVPVLGTNVVDQTRGSGLDITKFNFGHARVGQYGPIQLLTQGVQFNSPWIGRLVSRGVVNKTLKKAGYEGLPGGVLTKGGLPGVPLVG